MKNNPMKFPPLIFFLIILLSACSPSSGYLLEEAWTDSLRPPIKG